MQNFFSREKLLMAVVFFIILVWGITVFFSRNNDSQLKLARITEIGSLQNDGGLFYQNTTATLEDNSLKVKAWFPLRIPLKDPQLEKIRVGESVYVKEVQTSNADITVTSYVFTGFSRTNLLFWIMLIFLTFVVVMLGVQGLKYILPAILMAMIVVSGNISSLLTGDNSYLFAFVILIAIAFASISLQVKNMKIALIVSFSQAATLLLILLINIVLFEKLFLSELFYNNLNFLDLNFYVYWRTLNTAIIFISFGAIINATLDVAKGMITHKENVPGVAIVSLIKEGIRHHQYAVARIINVLFFVFLGLMFVQFVNFPKEKYMYFWDDPDIVHLLLLFINSATAALLVGPITAIITAIFLEKAAKNNSGQYKLNP